MRRAVVAAALALATLSPTAHGKAPPLSGEVNVVAFWATSCAPCRQELPLLEVLRQRLAKERGVQLVVVSLDEPRDADKARKLARELGLQAPVVVDEDLYVELFGAGMATVPRMAVLDRKRVGLERLGAHKDEQADAFVREVTAAIATVKAGTLEPPARLWRVLDTASASPHDR